MALVVWPVAAKPRGEVRVTVEDQPAFSRVMVDAPGFRYTIRREGDRLFVWFTEPPALSELPSPPRNVLAIQAVPGGVALTLPPGAVARNRRTGGRIVIDIDNPVAPAGEIPKPPLRATPAAAVEAGASGHMQPPLPLAAQAETGPPILTPIPPEPPPKTEPVPVPAKMDALPQPGPPKIETPASPPPPDPQPNLATANKPPNPKLPADEPEPRAEATPSTPLEPMQVWPLTRGALPAGPVALVASRSRPPAGLTGAGLLVPFAEPIGAAMFSRGAHTYAVFDERRPIDLASVRDDPVFGSAVVTIYPGATVIRLTPPSGQLAMLSRARDGWQISIGPAASRPAALAGVSDKGVMTFTAEAPGQVVAITDPLTGGTLLAGTQRKPGQGVAVERRAPEFMLPVTTQGVVVEPLSDAISLRVTPAGFVLSGPPGGLALSPMPRMAEAMLEAAGLTRNFQFPDQTTEALARRMKQQAIAAATAPPLARGRMRRDLAQTMIAVGLGVEAQTALRIAARDDPKEAASATAAGLAGIAALLAARPADSAGLDDPRLTGTDEIALWRAIRTAMGDEASPAAASVLSTTAALLLTYPEELRRRFLPLALETIILGGEPDAAARLLVQREDDPRLAYARALLKQARGDNAGALTLFDALVNGRSPLDHARASIRATELRLTMGQMDNKSAAQALDKRLYAWRGDGRDLALRRRVAALRRADGAWRVAFAMLRAAKADFPAQSAEVERQMKETFAALARDASLDTMPPTDLIVLLEENADLMADGPEGEPMRVRLAGKLMALDLPKRADPLLVKLMRAAPIGPAKAGFGATLATVRLQQGDGDGALLALSESSSAEMPELVRERRALIAARVQAKRGDTASAIEALAGVLTLEADETRAGIYEQAKDWPAARDALRVLATRLVPAEGALDDARLRVILRLATAAAQTGDDPLLESLREKLGGRIGSGPQADLFRLLTAEPVRGTADLVRARAEMGLARAITADTGARKPAKTP